ncbi:protein BOLA4, chloroplastic/mitochondrial [Cannabis sativa]|uniref:protein BOLA4, chloroplastic/mitochondrial n=1 Tax=Cannabis sativa TaxID=3483 RepID=UPI0029CA803A|nr:protein BOLA4, chloroplastic/mitochondrial [Cannabis sativa]
MSAKTLMARSYVFTGATNPLLTRMRESVPILARVTQTNQWLGSITTTRRTFITFSSREFHARVQSGLDFRAGGRRKIFTSTPVRAAHVNDAGSIDSPLINSMQIKIKEQLNAESVSVKDAYGDGRHVSIDVVSSAFEGQSAVNRQRMVYKAIWEELQNTVHAVDQMTTKTPKEAGIDQ